MPSTFNSDELLERVDNDDDFLRETVEMLASDGPDLLDDVRTAAAANDAASAARAAHTLKGMISNFCSPDTQAAALVVEQIGRAGDLAPLPAALDTLEARMTALIAELNDFVAERA
jgi:HPt (histidine-containing phosphotransfer) domain-containing protein